MSRNNRNTGHRRNHSNSLLQSILHVNKFKLILFVLIIFLIFLISFICVRAHFVSHSTDAFSGEIADGSSENTDDNLLNDDSKNSENSNDDNEEDNQNVDNDDSSDEEKNGPTTFTLAALGDVMCHNTQYFDAYNSATKEYDFSYVFDDIITETKIPNITVANLETTFAGEDVGYSNYPTFNSPDSLATALRDIGVDVVSTAGNHSLDKGFSGLSRTIDVLNDNLIYPYGTSQTAETQNKILYQYVKGVKIAFLSYTYGTNGITIPSDKTFCVNLIDKDFIKSQIDMAKNQGAELIVTSMHWGVEYSKTPSDEQKNLADFLFQNGVDIILGNHPHVLQPMEKRTVTLEDGTQKDGFVVYSLGNFTADQTDVDTKTSIILNLTITKAEDGKISIDDVSYTPIYMYKNQNVSTHKFKLLNIRSAIDNYENGTDTSIGKTTYNTLRAQLEKVDSMYQNINS